MITLLGFDEDSIEFGITGELAMQIAKLCGSPYGFAPNRTKAACRVTLFGESLTEFVCNVSSQDQEGDRDLFTCADPDCG